MTKPKWSYVSDGGKVDIKKMADDHISRLFDTRTVMSQWGSDDKTVKREAKKLLKKIEDRYEQVSYYAVGFPIWFEEDVGTMDCIAHQLIADNAGLGIHGRMELGLIKHPVRREKGNE